MAANDSYSVVENQTLTVPAPGVLANDTPGLGHQSDRRAGERSDQRHANLNTNGGFSLHPEQQLHWIGWFHLSGQRRATNSDPATVTIMVLSNRPPVANGDSYSVVSGRTLMVSAPGILSNDVTGWGTNLTAVLVSGPANGTLSLSANGGFSYTSANNFVGADGFTYEVNDGVTNSAPAMVTINVTTNYAPVANNDNYNTVTNTTLSVSAPGVLGNDTDANGDSLTAVLFSGPAHGTLSLTNNGGFSYTPTDNYVGTDTFIYQATDGLLNSATAVVTITITATAVSHPPVANNDSYSTLMNTTLTVGSPGLLANDTDPGGNNLTAFLVSGPANGTLILSTNGAFSYTPINNFVGTDTFIYQASDGATNSNPATVSFTVTTNQPAGNLVFRRFYADDQRGFVVALGGGAWPVGRYQRSHAGHRVQSE